MNLFEATDPEHFAYEPLVIKQVSKETEEASERLYDHVEQLDKKSSLPGWLGAVQTISLLAAGILTVGIFNGTGEVTLAEGFANAPGIYIGCVIAWLLWAVLFILTKTKAKKTTGSAEFAEVVKTGDDIEERVREELGDRRSDGCFNRKKWKDGAQQAFLTYEPSLHDVCTGWRSAYRDPRQPDQDSAVRAGNRNESEERDLSGLEQEGGL